MNRRAWLAVAALAALLFAIAPRRGLEMLRRGPRRWIVACATVEMALPFPPIAAGEKHVDSSIAAIVIATVPTADALTSIVMLGIVCTATAFVILMVLVKEVGAGRASIITYVNPVVAVTLGVIVLDESPGAGAIAGLLPILAGSWLATDGRLPLGREPSPPGCGPSGDAQSLQAPANR